MRRLGIILVSYSIKSLNSGAYIQCARCSTGNQPKECPMSRLPILGIENATGATAEVYAQLKKSIGSVPNAFAAIGAHGPAALKAILAADAVLASSSLSKRDQETIKLVISGVAGCDYCVAAHSLLGKL